MLDHLRTHAASWLTKTLLAFMAIGLIFFFGSSGFQNNSGGQNTKTNSLSEVNGENISLGLFDMNYDNQLRFYEQIFKGNVSDEIKERVKQNTLEQLINTKLFAQEAKKMGIRVSKTELIDTITQDPQFILDGSFNKNGYLKQFKPAFLKIAQVDYEDYLSEILLAEKFEDLSKNSVKVSDEEIKEEYLLSKTQLNLQKYSIDLNTLKDQNKDEKELEQKIKEIEQEVFSSLSESQPSLSKEKKKNHPASIIEVLKEKYKLEDENTGFYSLRESASLVGSDDLKANKKPLECISQLTAEQPWCKEAYNLNNRLVFFKLFERKNADMVNFEIEKSKIAADLENRKKNLILKQISDNLKKKAKIKTDSNLI